MYRNSTYLWCRYVKSRNPLSQKQCCPAVNVCCRYQNSMRMRLVGLRSKVKPKEEVGETTPPPSSLIKPALFTVLFSTASFTGAAIWQYENMRHRARELFRSPKKWINNKVEPAELWFRNKWNGNIGVKQGSFRNICNQWYNNLTEGQKIFAVILFVNSLVFVGWKVPQLKEVMFKYFTSNSASNRVCLPMVLSCFSHCSALHFAINMYVLNSFISNVVNVLGKEQFLALYLSSGVVAAFASQIFRVFTKQASLSLGASGCIMGIISYTCFKYPDTQLAIVFLPMVSFNAGTAIKVLMLVDFVCMITRFKFFDHAAHLGGALTGLFWHAFGNEHLWQKRGPLLEWWHKIRTGST